MAKTPPVKAEAAVDKLSGVHPALVRKVQAVLTAMASIGYPMKVVQGVRTADYQHSLWEQGRTRPGAIVTNCDGYTTKSNHQVKDDGFGHAVDCAFVVNGVVSFDDHLPWKAYGELGKALGLTWGGDFKSIADYGHLELKTSV